MGNSLLDICVFGRRAGTAAAAWSRQAEPGAPTLNHVAAWERLRLEAGLSEGLHSPVILPDYTRK
jgi:succinate dehydrogenase/fumarate reductase flavoprotein subunit